MANLVFKPKFLAVSPIRGQLTRNQRAKIVALVTIEVHARDVIDKLIKVHCQDKDSFDWLQQLRLYWDKDLDNCVVRQTNTQFEYGYEYLGNSGRLVITESFSAQQLKKRVSKLWFLILKNHVETESSYSLDLPEKIRFLHGWTF